MPVGVLTSCTGFEADGTSVGAALGVVDFAYDFTVIGFANNTTDRLSIHLTVGLVEQLEVLVL